MAVATRFDFTAPLPTVEQLGRVHLIAIGGAGMSAVALLLLRSGVAVSGSDARDSSALSALADLGAVIHLGHDAAQQVGADTVVVSSAIRDDNPELRAARARGARVLHRAQALAVVMQGRTRVAVAGANGKTTTTALLTVALRLAGEDPGFAIGGEPVQLAGNAALGSGEVFVAEADESDGSFVVYRPAVAVVTNVQPDHLDFYGNFAAVEDAYDGFARSIPSVPALVPAPGAEAYPPATHGTGLLVACADDAGSARLADRARKRGQRVLTYGSGRAADVWLTDLSSCGLAAGAMIRGDPGGTGTAVLRLQVPGRHNLLNAAAAYTAAVHGLGQDREAILDGLAAFSGTRRRFEAVGTAAGIRVVDDYAHNPGKVAALMETARGVAGRGRLVVAFQPHLYSRTRDFAQQLAASLSLADVAVVTDVYAAREDPIEGVSGRLIADLITDLPGAVEPGRTNACEVHYVADVDDVPSVLFDLVRPGDLVVTVGAGDITTVGPRLLAGLFTRSGGSQ